MPAAPLMPADVPDAIAALFFNLFF